MELHKFSSDLQELTPDQISSINGGETFWYWIFYAAGQLSHGLVDDIKSAANGTYKQSAGSAAMHSALG